ncbi:hypothetical protein ASG96_09325 [Terrabacter sp. Soil810]|nr:hypothetical protein ASG96_09325 [Terrabacter sp. Soil810]
MACRLTPRRAARSSVVEKPGEAFVPAGSGYAHDVIADDSQSLTQLTVRELVAELTRVEDRLREDAHHAGPRPLPGQVSREAALRRRERVLLAELAARRQRQSSEESLA